MCGKERKVRGNFNNLSCERRVKHSPQHSPPPPPFYEENSALYFIMTAYSLIRPDLVLLLGARTLVSLVGIVLILYGGNRAERNWDDAIADEDDYYYEEGDPAAAAASSNGNVKGSLGNKNNNNASGSGDDEGDGENYSASNGEDSSAGGIAGVCGPFGHRVLDRITSAGRATCTVTNKTNEYDAEGMISIQKPMEIYSTRKYGHWLSMSNMGFVLLIASVLMDCKSYLNMDISPLTICTAVVLLVIGIVQNVILPTLVQRQMVHHSQTVGLLIIPLLGGYCLLGFFMALYRDVVPTGMHFVSVLCIGLSYGPFWLARKRGDAHDRASVLHPNPTLFHPGGPMLAFGWVLFWISMNSVGLHPRYMYLPIYFTIRTGLAFVGAILIVTVYWVAGYAHDDYMEDPHDGSKPKPLHTYLLGRNFELRAAFAGAWLVLASAAFFPFYAEGYIVPPILFLLVALQGLAVGVQHTVGLRARAPGKLFKWTRATDLIYVAMSVAVYFLGGLAATGLVLVGCTMITGGWMVLHSDRKRGKYWVDNDRINPSYTVYSLGTLLLPAGLFVLAWGISLP
jgi:hypothetical protein